jgi:mannose-6-phosphate isomerase-like protein (cupin superfamily)
MNMKTSLLLLGLTGAVLGFAAQNPSDYLSTAELHRLTQKLAAETKKSGAGFASETLQKYGNHLTMLAHREADGSSELHEHDADLFVPLEGEATVITGGKMVGSKTTAPGELRGSGVEGGKKQALHVGDVIHIAAGIPHQLLVPKGHSFTYYVIKVKQ